jgi:FdhD protein
MNHIHQIFPYKHYSNHAVENRSVNVVVESIISLSVNGDTWLDFRCSPADIELLCVGFLYNERFIHTPEEILDIRVCDAGDQVDIWLDHSVEKPVYWIRTTGCNSASQPGSKQIGHLAKMGKKYPSSGLYRQIDSFYSTLAEQSKTRQGTHTSMLFDQKQIVKVMTDIGRHNTLDKLAGFCLLNHITLTQPVLITTGRISSEMVYKAVIMKIPLVISLHSTSDKAIITARELGITLVGHARRGQMDVYTHAQRILANDGVTNL